MDNEKLQKIDEIVNRTNASYEKAKNALEEANGDVLEAIILIQNENNSSCTDDSKQKGEKILEEIKKILKMGNATKLIIKKNNEVVVNLPITAGILGAFIAPFLTTAGVTAALLTQCSVEIQQADGNTIDVNQKVEESLNKVKSTVDDIKTKVQDEAEDFKEDIKDTFDDMN